jgi:hypothetical protein
MGHIVFASACAVYASKLLPHAQHTLAMGYRMRRFAVYASKLLPYAQHTLANCYSMRSIR